MNRIAIAAAALLLLAVPLAADTIHRTFNAAEGGTLTIDADVGDITIRTAPANGVTVNIERKASSDLKNLETTFAQSGNDVTVHERYNGGHHWFHWDSLDVHFTVTVPARYNVHLDTAGGDISVSDLRGSVNAHTSGGNLVLGSVTGPVMAKTSGGDIHLTASTGNIDVRTSGGNVKIGNVNGTLTAKTSGGDIDVHHAAADVNVSTSGGNIAIDEVLGAVDAHTSGGNIHARIAQQPRHDSTLSTSGGGVTVTLAPNVAVDLDAHTSGGSVESDMSVTVIGKITGENLEGKINGGGPRLTLRASGGSIHLHKG